MARGLQVPCERTRTLVSALLDGAGGEFEARLVEAHLRTCADCRAFRDQAEGITSLLRAAPLESFVCQVKVSRAAVRHHRARRLASVAAAFAGVAFVGSVAQTVAPAQDQAETVVIGASLVQPAVGEESIRSLARQGLVEGVTAPQSDVGQGAKPALPVVN